MTYEEAIKRLKFCNTDCECDFECGRCIEAVNLAIAVLEKQIPKKPQLYEDKYYMCECGNILKFKDEDGIACCLNCGQANDWSEVE